MRYGEKRQTDRPDRAWYHPAVLAWILGDMVHEARSYVRQKWYSLRGRRWVVAMYLQQAMQQSWFVARDEDLPMKKRKQALRTMKSLHKCAEELKVDDHFLIEKYIEQYQALEDELDVIIVL